MYFISHTLQKVERWYQTIEKIALADQRARYMQVYYQNHPIIVKNDYPIMKILSKPDLDGTDNLEAQSNLNIWLTS